MTSVGLGCSNGQVTVLLEIRLLSANPERKPPTDHSVFPKSANRSFSDTQNMQWLSREPPGLTPFVFRESSETST